MENKDMIAGTLKVLRKRTNMTAKDASFALKEYGFNISAKTIYGYENSVSSPNADVFIALCQIYKCNNILEEFSDSTNVFFTNREWNVIERYMRNLNSEGQQRLINYAEDLIASGKYKPEHMKPSARESIYDISSASTVMKVADNHSPYMSDIDHEYQPNAAHSRNDIEIEESVDTSENHIMDDKDF